MMQILVHFSKVNATYSWLFISGMTTEKNTHCVHKFVKNSYHLSPSPNSISNLHLKMNIPIRNAYRLRLELDDI